MIPGIPVAADFRWRARIELSLKRRHRLVINIREDKFSYACNIPPLSGRRERLADVDTIKRSTNASGRETTT